VRNWWTYIRSPDSVVLLLMVFTACVALSQLPKDNPRTTTTAGVMVAKAQKRSDLVRAAALIVAKSNEFREEQGLNPMEVNAKLAHTANYFADYMARSDKYSHTADGKTPSERAEENGYDYCLVSENIAYVDRSAGIGTDELAKKMVEVWKQSAEHRKNMLDPLVMESGVAVAHSGKTGKYYGVQLFGRPKSLSIGLAIENKSQVPIEYTLGERTYQLPSRSRQSHEECLPADLTFQLPDESKPERYTLRPHDGNHFVISGPANELKIEKK
jgi:uncharacterized protein YkwD